MPWIDLTRPATIVALLPLSLGLVLSAAAAETIVVRSSGPSMKAYPPGKALADSARIVLKPNDQVVILDGRGTRTLKGPGTYSPTIATDRPTDLRTTFADASGRRARPGAVRGVTTAMAGTPKSPNIWFVDVGHSSIQCVTDPARVTLWRPDRLRDATMTITANGQAAQVKWAAGESTQMWPATLPVASGTQYRLSWPGAAQPTTISFAVLGPNPSTGLEGMAAALIKNRCEAQLNLLIETVALPEAQTSPAG